jgi:hypothetical protein
VSTHTHKIARKYIDAFMCTEELVAAEGWWKLHCPNLRISAFYYENLSITCY